MPNQMKEICELYRSALHATKADHNPAAILVLAHEVRALATEIKQQEDATIVRLALALNPGPPVEKHSGGGMSIPCHNNDHTPNLDPNYPIATVDHRPPDGATPP